MEGPPKPALDRSVPLDQNVPEPTGDLATLSGNPAIETDVAVDRTLTEGARIILNNETERRLRAMERGHGENP